MKNDTNEDERSEVIPDVISQSADNLELKVIDETQTISRNEVHVNHDMEEGVTADQTQENEGLKMNYENERQELEPDSSNKSVLVNDAWKQYKQQSTNQ